MSEKNIVYLEVCYGKTNSICIRATKKLKKADAQYYTINDALRLGFEKLNVTRVIVLSKEEAYNAILSIFFELTKNVAADSIEMINAKDRLDLLIDGKLFAFYQIIEFDANADENDKNSDSCWYEERWYDSDLENALLYHEVPVTEKTMKLMREKCKHIFDDKSARNEMLEDMAFEIKEAIQKAKEDQSTAYMMIITKETDEYPEKSLNYFADRPWKGTYVKTLVGNTVEDFFEETDIEGLFYQLIDNRKGIRISHGSVDIDRIAEEISEYQKNNGGKSDDINK